VNVIQRKRLNPKPPFGEVGGSSSPVLARILPIDTTKHNVVESCSILFACLTIIRLESSSCLNPRTGPQRALGGTTPAMDSGMKRTMGFRVAKDALSVLAHGAHGFLVVAVAVPTVPVRVVRIEAEVVDVVLVVRRRRPIVAVRTNVVELATPAAARSGEKNGSAVRTGKLHAVNAVLRSPHTATFVHQFLHLPPAGHHPRAAPVDRGDIVLGAGNAFTNVTWSFFPIYRGDSPIKVTAVVLGLR